MGRESSRECGADSGEQTRLFYVVYHERLVFKAMEVDYIRRECDQRRAEIRGLSPVLNG